MATWRRIQEEINARYCSAKVALLWKEYGVAKGGGQIEPLGYGGGPKRCKSCGAEDDLTTDQIDLHCDSCFYRATARPEELLGPHATEPLQFELLRAYEEVRSLRRRLRAKMIFRHD